MKKTRRDRRKFIKATVTIKNLDGTKETLEMTWRPKRMGIILHDNPNRKRSVLNKGGERNE